MADKLPSPPKPTNDQDEEWLDADEVLREAQKLGEVPRPRPRKMPSFNKGGMVKAGSPKVSAPCADSKTIKCL